MQTQKVINYGSVEYIKERNIGIDIVKSIAIVSVVGVHFFLNTKFYRVGLNNINLFIQTVIQQIFLICIPLFIMSTGYLNNNTEINKKYFKKILPVLYVYLLYSIPALIYRYNIGEISGEVFLWIEQIFKFKGHRYSWYIDLYFGLFLMMPFLNKMYKSLETKKEKQILISILVLLTSATALINGKFIKVFHLPTYWNSIYPLTYFFIGKYIREFQPRMNILKNVVYLFLVIFIQAVLEYYVASGGEYKHYLTDYSSLARLAEAYLLFILVYKLEVKNKYFNKVVVDISKITLDIYLASFITDRLTYKILKPYDLSQETYLYLMIPLIFISFSFAYMIAKLRVRYIKIK